MRPKTKKLKVTPPSPLPWLEVASMDREAYGVIYAVRVHHSRDCIVNVYVKAPRGPGVIDPTPEHVLKIYEMFVFSPDLFLPRSLNKCINIDFDNPDS